MGTKIRAFRIAVVLILSCGFAAAQAFGQTWSNNYAYRRTITIDHTKVGNSDQANFPILVSGTYSYLATIPNGGDVTNANGYDIVFTSDAAGTSGLSFERESYSSTNGAVTFWVKIPTLSHTADVVIYLFYGNGAVTTDQSNKTDVWGSNFKGVWHFGTTSTLSLSDSTANAFDLTNHNSTGAVAGRISGAANFNGTNNY